MDSIATAMLSVKSGVFVIMLALLWGWESWRPFFGVSVGRVRHGLRHFAIAGVNGLLVPLCCGVATIFVATAAAAGD